MDMVSSNPCPYTVSVNIHIGGNINIIYIHIYGSRSKGPFRDFPLRRPPVLQHDETLRFFSGARESIFLAKDLAKDLF